MRDLLNILDNTLEESMLSEKALTRAELVRNEGKYLEILVDIAKKGLPFEIDPGERDKYGDQALIDPSMIPALEQALASDDMGAALPKKLLLIIDGNPVTASWGALFKGTEFTGRDGQKEYNAGHLSELFMGLAVSAKFINLGADITAEQVISLAQNTSASVPPKEKTYLYTLTYPVKYPDPKSKVDTVNFLARVPVASATSFNKQLASGEFKPDLRALLASSVLYANESSSVATACQRVRQDKNNNTIDIVSDGTSDAKSTKADLILKIDGAKINLLSLKTYSSDTLGQISGLGFDQVSKWFDMSFGINLDKYQSYFDETLDPAVRYKNIAMLYDKVIFPQVKKSLENQRPGKEAAIVKQLARAANYFARGESMEDVEIVKLDDKIKSGNYKIMRFSDDLEEAMSHLDLEAKLIDKAEGRTIQIWVKPEPGEKVAKGANRLCQFRTQKMGTGYRNYFETGAMLEKLTAIEQKSQADRATDQPGITRSNVKANQDSAASGDAQSLGRARRKR
jgi:hypothetical protein